MFHYKVALDQKNFREVANTVYCNLLVRWLFGLKVLADSGFLEATGHTTVYEEPNRNLHFGHTEAPQALLHVWSSRRISLLNVEVKQLEGLHLLELSSFAEVRLWRNCLQEQLSFIHVVLTQVALRLALISKENNLVLPMNPTNPNATVTGVSQIFNCNVNENDLSVKSMELSLWEFSPKSQNSNEKCLVSDTLHRTTKAGFKPAFCFFQGVAVVPMNLFPTLCDPAGCARWVTILRPDFSPFQPSINTMRNTSHLRSLHQNSIDPEYEDIGDCGKSDRYST